MTLVERPRRDTAASISLERISELAYRLWNERGCPIGSPDEDWFRAEEELRNHREMFGPGEDERQAN
ncbi:MAG: DUF2934 domain-containing protein [Acidobacteriia bacterium]|nr:DUF2934 domain-containing protein [Terriglobia bacterium]